MTDSFGHAKRGHAGAAGTIRKRYLGPSATRTITGTRGAAGSQVPAALTLPLILLGGITTRVHCNMCVPSIYSGARCVLDYPEPLIVR